MSKPMVLGAWTPFEGLYVELLDVGNGMGEIRVRQGDSTFSTFQVHDAALLRYETAGLRDMFAMAAVQGLNAAGGGASAELADTAYRDADAMIEARRRKSPVPSP